MKNNLLRIISIAIIILNCNCSSTIQLEENPKIFSTNDIAQINRILNDLTDTLVISIDSIYLSDPYVNLPSFVKDHYAKLNDIDHLPSSPDSAYILGIEHAKRDIKKGNLVLVEELGDAEVIIKINDGPAFFTRIVYDYILQNKYGINVRRLNNTPSADAYIHAYQSILLPVIRKFYGFDALRKARDEVSEVIQNEGDKHPEWRTTY